jgi:ammonium transporter, Amt family
MEPIWVVTLAAGALLMRLGQALYQAGLVRSKNASSAVMRNIVDFAVVTICFWLVGAAILRQTSNSFFGLDLASIGARSDFKGLGFGLLALVLAVTGVVNGAIAERARFRVGALCSLMLSALIIPMVARWVWGGWLGRMAFVDQAGATVLHIPAGTVALVAALLLGPRLGKYNHDGSSNFIPGHSLVLNQLGVLVMTIAFVPYVLAAVTIHENAQWVAAMDVMLAASAGALTSLFIARLRYGKVDVLVMCSGLLGGAVASTAGPGVSPIAAVLIGIVAGIVVPMATVLIDVKFRIDDPGNVIAIHLVGGIWGTLAAGLLKPHSIPFATRMHDFGVQALGAVSAIALAGVVSLIVFTVARMFGPLRVSEADEFDGCDLAEHDVNAYPDFQQTTIKSYHLREA